MKYYSTNKQAPVASLQEAVVKGLLPIRAVYAYVYQTSSTGLLRYD